MELANQINKVIEQNTQLSKMSDPASIEDFTIPNIEKSINNFTNTLQEVNEFNELPDLVLRVVRLLQERQSYELLVSDKFLGCQT